MSSYMDEQTKKIQEMYNKQQEQQILEAQKGRDNELTALERQLQENLPGYQVQRNQADVQSAVDVNKSKELMASMGAYSSGDNINMQGRLFTDRSNKMSSINTDENTFKTGIGNKKNDVSSNYLLTEGSIKNNISAQMAKALQDLAEAEKQRQWQMEQEAAARAWQEKQAAAERAWQEKQQLAERAWQEKMRASSGSSGGSSGGYSGGSSRSSSGSSSSNALNNVRSGYAQALQGGTSSAYKWLSQNQNDIIDAVGSAEYGRLKDNLYKVVQENSARYKRDRSIRID